MLKISPALTSAKISAYFRENYTARSESAYYSQNQAIQGVWHGDLAHYFGLTGLVTEEQFTRLAEGKHPDTGEVLIKPVARYKRNTQGEYELDAKGERILEKLKHRAGYDLTISAPKSVSATALVGGDYRVILAHRKAVQTTLDRLQPYVQARISSGVTATSGNWICALFEHDTSRPTSDHPIPAPQLHTHVVMANMTLAGDRIRSIDPAELFRIQSYATAIYRAELASHLLDAGYALEHKPGRAFEIKGYTAEYLDALSPRRNQIEAELAKQGRSGAAAASLIALNSREAKEQWNPVELRAAHQKQAQEFGDQPKQVVDASRLHQRRAIDPQYQSRLANDAITYAKERLIERAAVFDEYEIIRDALRYRPGKLTLEPVEQAFAERKGPGRAEFQQVGHYRPNAPGARYTTPEMLAMENGILGFTADGIGTRPQIAKNMKRDDFRAEHDYLNNGQKYLVWNVLHSQDRVIGIQGGAGTGKTTALKPLRELIEAQGYDTLGVSATSGAAKELAKTGMETQTIPAFLLQPPPAIKPRVLFLDEASLASTKQVYALLPHVRPQDRLILVGDIRQHKSIEAGRIFHELQQAGMTTYRLDKIVRQQDPITREAVTQFAAGKLQNGLSVLDHAGRVEEIDSRPKRLDAIARAYADDPKGTLVISPDNKSRQDINEAIRGELVRTGTLGKDRFTLDVLISRQEITSADTRIAATYHPGDVIRYPKANKAVGVKARDYATVVASDSDLQIVTVKRHKDGQKVTYNPRQAQGLQFYQTEHRAFAVGERIQFTAPAKDRGIVNRQLGTIRKLDEHGNAKIALDGHQTVKVNLNKIPHLDYGYSMTSFSAQAQTVNRVLLHVDTASQYRSLLDKTLAYVAVSRAVNDVRIFCDDKQDMVHALEQSRQKPIALSLEQVRAYRKEPAYAVA